MKNIKKNGIILIGLTIIVLFVVLKDNFISVANLLKNVNITWILIACIFQVGLFLLESLALDQIIKSYRKDYPFKKSLQLDLMTKFFNGITPFSTGGQPMQIYFLNKDGFRVTKATNIIMQNFILYQFSLITVGTFAIIMNYFFHYFENVPFLRVMVTIGFIINTLVMLGIFVISFSNKFNKFIVNLGLNILTKLKIIKDPEEQRKKWMERCNDFHEGATYIKEHKWLCLKGYIYNVLGLLSLYAIPFFIVKSLDGSISISLIQTIVASSYVLIIGSFVPIPGASGGIEYGFLQFFGHMLGGELLSATLLIWRTITYYLPMLIGAIILNLRKEN